MTQSPLYPITSKWVRDEWDSLRAKQLDPWIHFNSGKNLTVPRAGSKTPLMIGGGVTFEGSPRVVFWTGYIEPFLETIAFRFIDKTLALCKEKQFDPRLALPETVELLKQLVRDTYHRMAEIDQRLRGKGLPNSVAKRGVDSEIATMDTFIDARLSGELAMAQPRRAGAQAMDLTNRIPATVIGEVAQAFAAYYSHPGINNLFLRAGVPSEPPPGAKLTKIGEWLRQVNESPDLDALAILGKLLEEYMDRIAPNGADQEEWDAPRTRIRDALSARGLSYQVGGKIVGGMLLAPSRSLGELIRDRHLPAIHAEFERAESNISSDPPAAVTAACAILEATFRTYIADESLPLPSDQSIHPLWRTVQKHLALDPGSVHDADQKRILGGLASIVDGIGSLRTHAGSAHGHGPEVVAIDSRRARLAVHAAHTAVTFILETWASKKSSP